jgi:hypothetical protein
VSRPTFYQADTVVVRFDLKQSDLSGGENFLVQYYNGSTWVTLADLTSNNIGGTYSTFTYHSANVAGLLSIDSIRFREGSFANADRVFVDNLNINFRGTCVPAQSVSNANGLYNFNMLDHNLLPSTNYEIRIDKSQSGVNGYVVTNNNGSDTATDNNGTDAGSYITSGLITTPPAGADKTYDFGFLGYSVGNQVWWDADGNGTRGTNEVGIAGVEMALLRSDGSLFGTTTTDEDGKYYFGGLPAGSYQVAVVSPLENGPLNGATLTSTLTTTDVDDNNNGSATNPNSNAAAVSFTSISEVFTLSGKNEPTNESDEDPIATQPDNQSNLTIDFGFRRLSIGDFVWRDDNKNGIQDSGEPGVAGVTVELFDNNGNLAYVGCAKDSVATDFSSTSDNDGSISFSDPWSFKGSNTGRNSDRLRISGNGGEATRPMNRPSGYVVENVTISFNASQSGVGVTEALDIQYHNGSTWITFVTLFGETGIVGSISSDERFFTFSSDLYPGLTDITQIRFRESSTAGFGNNDYVYIDDLKIVFSERCFPARVETDENGYYNFNSADHDLEASTTYQIRIPNAQNNLEGLTITSTGQGNSTNDNNGTEVGNYFTTGNITTPSSGQNMTYDFGFYPVSIGDYVWIDKDADGVQDEDEVGIPGVVLTLHQTNGSPVTYTCGIDSVATGMIVPSDNQGSFNFSGKWISTTDPLTLLTGERLNISNNTDASRMLYRPSQYGINSVRVEFEVSEDNDLDGGDDMRVQYFNGSSWITLDDIAGSEVSKSSYTTFSYSSSSNSGLLNIQGIRFRELDGIDNNEAFYVDDLKIVFEGTCNVETTTDENGFYLFKVTDGVSPNADYQIRLDESQPALLGLAVTSTGQGTSDNDNNGIDAGSYIRTGTVTAPSSGQDLSFDFGFKGYSIGNLVWWDENNDGDVDNGEDPIPGVEMGLLNAQGVLIETTTTDADGEYYFHGLLPGNYQVAVLSPILPVFCSTRPFHPPPRVQPMWMTTTTVERMTRLV